MSIMQLEREGFKQAFPAKGFRVKHNLLDSELLKLPRLAVLASSLPKSSVEHNLGDLDASQDPSKTRKNNLSVAETVAQIENCNSWMVLKNVEHVNEYKALIEQCLSEIDPLARPIVGSRDMEMGYIFISSPGSVTPFHMDPEHNFLLQIRGLKTMYVFDRLDRELIPETILEEKYGEKSSHRNASFDDSQQTKSEEYLLSPGDGLFVPQNAPHWVKNGDEVSISFSVTFRSQDSERLARLYALNGKLRRMGFKPNDVMRSPTRDLIKDTLYRAYRKSKALVSSK